MLSAERKSIEFNMSSEWGSLGFQGLALFMLENKYSKGLSFTFSVTW